MIKTLNVNLFGAPGSGKSTMMAALFSKLKMAGYDVEMTPEYAKRKVWEESFDVLNDQVYIFGKQYHSMHILQGKVDVVITDSPLLLSMYYVAHNETPVNIENTLKWLALAAHHNMDNLNIMVNRVKPYNPKGRMQNVFESDEIGIELKTILNKYSVEYIDVHGNYGSINVITDYIIKRLEK